MKKEDIRAVVAELRRELRRAEDIDPDFRARADALHRDVEKFGADEATDQDVHTLVDRARELESQFAARHPTLARVARQLADTLAKMGI